MGGVFKARDCAGTHRRPAGDRRAMKYPGRLLTRGRASRSSWLFREQWCRRGESNPRPRDYETLALPLSYAGVTQSFMLRTNRQKCQVAPAPQKTPLQCHFTCRRSRHSSLMSAPISAPVLEFAARRLRTLSVDSTSVPPKLELRYPCCYAFWNTTLAPDGSSLPSRMAKARRKY
jgi:hypothetical protein